MTKPWEKYKRGPWERYQSMPPDIQGAADKAVAGVATAMPEIGSFNDVYRSSGGNIPAMLGQALANPAVRVGMGSQLNDYGENLQRLGQKAGELVGVLGPNDRAVMEQRLAVDDAGMKAMRDNRPAETYLGRGIMDTAVMGAVPGGVGTSMAARTSSGALINGLQLAAGTGEGESPWANFALGASFGAALPVVTKAVGSFVNRLSTKPIQVIQDGKFTPEAMKVLDQKNITPAQLQEGVELGLREGGVTKEMLENFNLFKEEGITPTLANITTLKDDWMLQREWQKYSGRIPDTVALADKQLAERMDALITQAGGKATNSTDAGLLVSQAIFDRVNSVDASIDAAYKAARESAQSKGMKVSVPRLAARLRMYAKENTGTAGLIDAVVGDLERRGLLVDMSAKGRRTSVDHIEEVRKYINVLVREKPQERTRVGRILKDALDEDVASAVGEDVFAPARQAKAQFERSLERARTTRRDAGKDTLVEMLIDNRGNPDQLISQIGRVSTRSEDVAHLRRFLESGTAEQIESGRQALREVKSALLRDLLLEATNKTPLHEGGVATFSGPKFRDALDRIGNQKISILFDAEEMKHLGNLTRISQLRIPREGTAIGGGPSSPGIHAAVGDAANAVARTVTNASDPVTGIAMQSLNKVFSFGKKVSAERRLLNVETQLQKAIPSRVPADAL